ncbi:MAG: DUF4367 domain-containing protein [Clostridia bacterium]|nr:DUF4367 domain-containing protein [Clostridia bacterium]
MPISKAEFKEAFREVISSEFSHIPKNENEIDFVFSERFNKRMTKLVNSQKKAYYYLINTAAKRVAIIFVLILTMFTAAFSVKAIREPIIEFVKQIYETFIHYSVEGDTIDKITKKYSITRLPEGFYETDKVNNNYTIITFFENSSGDTIVFSQMTTKTNAGYFLDNETGEVHSEVVNGINVEWKKWYDNITVLWTNEGYVFSIECMGNINFDTIKDMICSVE